METLVAVVKGAIYIIGIGGLVYWMRKWFKALQSAVDAQKATIEAQKNHIESIKNFLDIADTPKWAERYQAFEEIVEREKAALLKEAERKFEEERKALTENRAKVLTELFLMFRNKASLYFEAVSHLAVNFHYRRLDWELYKSSFSPGLQEQVEEFMSKLPGLAPPSPPPFLDESPQQPVQRLKDRMTKPELQDKK